MEKNQILQVLQENKRKLSKQFHISKLGLFGSYAKGNPRAQSDIDLVYELEEDTFLGIKELYELEVFLKELFEAQEIDLVNRKYMNPIVAHEMTKSVIYV